MILSIRPLLLEAPTTSALHKSLDRKLTGNTIVLVRSRIDGSAVKCCKIHAEAKIRAEVNVHAEFRREIWEAKEILLGRGGRHCNVQQQGSGGRRRGGGGGSCKGRQKRSDVMWEWECAVGKFWIGKQQFLVSAYSHTSQKQMNSPSTWKGYSC